MLLKTFAKTAFQKEQATSLRMKATDKEVMALHTG
jgi:hypothetical protein